MARAELVARVLHGRPIDRLWALRMLLVGEAGDRCPGVIVVLFPATCSGCGGSHLKRADEWRRAALSLQPGALEELRRADPSLRAVLDLNVPEDRRRALAHPRARGAGMPVARTPEATERLQILWAIDLAARREHPLKRRRRRTRITREATAPEEGGKQ